MLAVKNSRTRWAVAESGEKKGRELDTVARESYRCRGSGLGNQCRVVGHEELLNICMIISFIIRD